MAVDKMNYFGIFFNGISTFPTHHYSLKKILKIIIGKLITLVDRALSNEKIDKQSISEIHFHKLKLIRKKN